MQNIRQNVFETNSSSVHSLVIVSKDEFDALKNCDMLLDYNTLIPVEKAYQETMETLAGYEDNMSEAYKASYKNDLTLETFKEELKKFDCYSLTHGQREDAASETIEDNRQAILAALPEDYNTYESYGGDMYETFYRAHTTKSGDEIVAFGYYGHD